MTAPRMATGDVRERDERDARFFAWDVPADANIVALVHEPDEAERSATVVDAIATSVARRREHTLLLSAEAGPSPLDELLGGTESEGLPAALGGRARLTDVAVQRVDRPFVYLPAGRDPEALRKLLEDDLLATFVGRVRERGGTLFMVLSDETLACERISRLIDGYVALGDVSLPASMEGLTVYGRIRFGPDRPAELESVEAIPAAGNGNARDAIADREPTGGGTDPEPTDVIGATDPTEAVTDPESTAGADAGPADAVADAGPAAAVADAEPADASADPEPTAAVPDPGAPESTDDTELLTEPDLKLWTIDADPVTADSNEALPLEPEPFAIEVSPDWTRHRNPPGFPTVAVAGAIVAVLAFLLSWWWFARGTTRAGTGEPTTLARAEAAPVDVRAPTPPPFDPGTARVAFEGAPELGLSVLIASYADEGDARERLGRLRSRASESGALFFVAPTPVRGIVYHRVFAGALADRDTARSLMLALVERGQKDEASAWDIRPARLAFDLGMFGSRDEASGRVAMLAERGIAAYVIAAPLDADSVYQVYGGAYESERASLPMAEQLDAAGEAASLISRHGVPHPSPGS